MQAVFDIFSAAEYVLSYVYFRLQTNAACITIAQMNAPEKTIVGGIRLTPSYWTKFRQVWSLNPFEFRAGLKHPITANRTGAD